MADELRRMVVAEVVADTAVAGRAAAAAVAAGVFGITSAVAGRVRRRRRARRGRCAGCGYDLFGSRHSNRCPECGREVV